MSNRVGPVVVHHVVRGGNFPSWCALFISFEKGECDIWWRAFHTVSCPLLSLYGCLAIEGDSDQLPLDPLSELLPSLFLPSELSSSSVSSSDALKLSDDRNLSGLLLVFGLLECCDFLEFLFFFKFFFNSRTCCFSASKVSMFFSSLVRSLDELLFFNSTILASWFVLERLWCRWDGSSFCSFLISDLTIILQSAFSEGVPSGHLLSLLDDRSVFGRGFSPFRITIGSFLRPEYTITFSI